MECRADGGQDHALIDLGSFRSESVFAGLELEERRVYVNSLSPRQMDSLTAICDTFLPSITLGPDINSDDSILKFYKTSASMARIPDQVNACIYMYVFFFSFYLIL